MIIEILVITLMAVTYPFLFLATPLQIVGQPIMDTINGISAFIAYPVQLIIFIVGREFIIATFAILLAWTITTYGYTMLFFVVRKIPFINIR